MENAFPPTDPVQPAPTTPEDGSGRIVRETPSPQRGREDLVNAWTKRVIEAKQHWDPVFKQMRENMDFVSGLQWPGQKANDDDRYVANITHRHVALKVAALYAKNPKVVARRRRKLDFSMWNGSAVELQNAQTQAQLSMQQGLPLDPSIMQLMQDVQNGTAQRAMLDKVASTLEILFEHTISEQAPDFKAQMKQLVRRVAVTGVGYVKVGFERVTEARPEDADKIRDITTQLVAIERLAQDVQDGKVEQESKEAEQLALMLKELQDKPEVLVREGVVFDFPPATSIIIDPSCRQLSAFVGASWVCQEFILTPDQVKEVYKVDLGKSYTTYRDSKNPGNSGSGCERCTVWEIYSKVDRMKYVVVDGYPDFLVEPSTPYPELDGFWPILPLVFNEVENEKQIYPPSDVRLLMPIQREYNRARESLREHRHANRPAYATPFGALDTADKDILSSRPANAIIELRGLQPGQSVESILQHIKPAPLDPAVYETGSLVDDTLRILGHQEANMGGTAASGTTATEVSVAEGTRMTQVGSNVDDLDQFLSALAKAAGEIMLKEFTPEYVTKVVGAGAVWPQFSREQISEQLFLEIEAGSSGRPNRAVEVQNWERLAPILMQIPGINPEWMAKETIKRLDDRIDTTDIVIGTLPSIVSMNAQKQLAMSADPSADPNAQGMQGAQNAPQAAAAPGAPGPQAPDIPAVG